MLIILRPNLEGRYTSLCVPQSWFPPLPVRDVFATSTLPSSLVLDFLLVNPRHSVVHGGCTVSSPLADCMQLHACLNPGAEKSCEVLLARYSLGIFLPEIMFILQVVINRKM